MTPARTTEPGALREALEKINAIRNSIIGLQTMNWSEHVYPLVAALEAAGFAGMDYPEARENFGTMLERTNAAEDRADRLAAQVEAMRAALTKIAAMTEMGLVRVGAPDAPWRLEWSERPTPAAQIARSALGLPEPEGERP